VKRLGLSALVLVAGCSRCGPSAEPTALEIARAADVVDAEVTSTSDAAAYAPLDTAKVEHAYAELFAGHAEVARTLFGELGTAKAVTPDEVEKGLFSPRTTQRGFAYWRGDLAIHGRYLVARDSSGLAAIQSPDDFSVAMTVQGDIVAAVDGGTKLVVATETPLARPTTRKGETLTVRVEVRVVDPVAKKTSSACVLGDAPRGMLDHGPEARLFAHGSRLLLRAPNPFADVIVCAVEPGHVLARFPTEGGHTWVIDRDEQHVLISGIPTATKEIVEHAEVDAVSGAAQRLRTKEETADIPGRAVLLGPDGGTLLVGSHRLLTLFSTKPFQRVASLKLSTEFGSFDSSYNLTPRLTLLPDGTTVEAVIETTDNPPPTGQPVQTEHVWRVSLATRRLDDPTGQSTARPPTAKTTANAGADDDAIVAARVASNLCSIGGVFVPKAACPAPR
jgi:hypothetical protein